MFAPRRVRSTRCKIRCVSGHRLATWGDDMFGSGRNIALMWFARAVVALAFLTPNIAPSRAQDLDGSGSSQRGVTSFGGHAAMVGVRLPLGGDALDSSHPIVGLRFGSSWRAGPGSTGVPTYRFVPTVEAGFSLRGDPIFRLSSFTVRLDQLRAAAEGAQGETFCGRNLSVCLVGGIAIVAIAVVALAGSGSCESSSQYLPGTPQGGVISPPRDPCQCYEASGC